MKGSEQRGSLTDRRKARLAKALAQRQQDLTLVLANIHDPHNVSAIFRSCDAFGVDCVNLFYTITAFPALGRKSSASARKWVESRKFSDPDLMYAQLRREGFTILATSFTPRAKSFWEYDFLKPAAIVLGNEHAGVEEELVKKADGEIFVPMYGLIQSLNVSVAAAVILSEAARQREKAGYYARSRMAAAEYERRLAEWYDK